MSDLKHYGTCDCGGHECVVARAVRQACAERVAHEITSEYGDSTNYWSDLPLSLFSPDEWVCRSFPSRCVRPCPSCGYLPAKVPGWVVHGIVFGLRGKTYRVVSVGGTNEHASNRLHYEDFVVCELVSSEPWCLPEGSVAKSLLARALGVFRQLPKFRPVDLEGAMFACPDVEEQGTNG